MSDSEPTTPSSLPPRDTQSIQKKQKKAKALAVTDPAIVKKPAKPRKPSIKKNGDILIYDGAEYRRAIVTFLIQYAHEHPRFRAELSGALTKEANKLYHSFVPSADADAGERKTLREEQKRFKKILALLEPLPTQQEE